MVASVQAQLNAAFAQIGAIFGGPYQVFRPCGPMNPILSPIGTVVAAFDTAAALKFRSPAVYGKPIFYAATDPSVLVLGDYLVGPVGTLFVAGLEPTKPAVCVRCNAAVTLMRAAPAEIGTAGFGATVRDANGGAQRSNEPAYLTGWPASVLQGTKGEGNPAGLPDDVRAPWVAVLLPVLPLGVTVQTGDQFTTDMGLTYTVSSAELTDLGWRLTAAYGMT